MTDAQKQQIRDMRQKGVVYSQIANTLDISINSIKSFCQRNNIPAGKAAVTHKLKTNIKKKTVSTAAKNLNIYQNPNLRLFAAINAGSTGGIKTEIKRTEDH